MGITELNAQPFQDGFTKGLRLKPKLRLSQGPKSEPFVFTKSWTLMDFTKDGSDKSRLTI